MELFDLLTNGPREQMVYRLIPARDAALNIFHFWHSIIILEKQFANSLKFRAFFDLNLKAEAKKSFELKFPNCDAVRHAVAHAGQMFKNPELLKINLMTKTESRAPMIFPPGSILTGLIRGSSFSISHEGTIFDLHINVASCNALGKIKDGLLSRIDQSLID